MNNRISQISSQQSSHALVIGGSIVGLLAARVLVEHFERVTVIERDYYPENPQPRSGVPQSNQGHFLLARGKQIKPLFLTTSAAAISLSCLYPHSGQL